MKTVFSGITLLTWIFHFLGALRSQFANHCQLGTEFFNKYISLFCEISVLCFFFVIVINLEAYNI